MTRDEVIRMAREARLSNESGAFGYPYLPELERFAALVAAHEREACAAICDNAEKRKWTTFVEGGVCTGISAADCARAIRARGDDETVG